MAAPRVCVLRAPGTNCDIETAYAFDVCGARSDRVHLFRLLEAPGRLADYQVLCVPGGFSYGDDIGAGVIFSRKLRVRLGEALAEFLQADKLVLGICNGFQVLVKAGILPAGDRGWPPATGIPPQATVTWNTNGKYTAHWVRLRVCSDRNVFLRGIEEIEMPVAHAEGRVAVADEAALDDWQASGQITLRYRPRLGRAPEPNAHSACGAAEPVLPYPDNPNGSVGNIAGFGDASGRVLGLMPHPERFLFATQHPHWTGRGARGDGDGLRLFGNAVEYFA